jgi:hypothetical protein
METLVTAPKRTTNIRAGVNLLGISDFLISERCYGHCTERCSLVPIQRPRKPIRRCAAARGQACRLVPKLPPISMLAQRRELARYPALSACNRFSGTSNRQYEFQQQRAQFASVTMDLAMSINPTFAIGRFLQRTRFVVVNDRIPRIGGHCASCGGIIEKGYVRDAQTLLTYCDTQCLPGEASAMPRVNRGMRKAS